MPEINLITAFGAGLLTFFAPCTFVTLPAFINYLFLQASGDVAHGSDKKINRLKLITTTSAYAIGFLLVFTFLGVAASGIGSFLRKFSETFTNISGLLILLMGVLILVIDGVGGRFSSTKFALGEYKIKVSPGKLLRGHVFAFVLGTASAFAWTPCIGPVLGGILLWTGTISPNVSYGALLLFLYGLGIMLPFLGIAILFGRIDGAMTKLNKYSGYIYRLSALILILIGLALILGWQDTFFASIFRVFIDLGYRPQ